MKVVALFFVVLLQNTYSSKNLFDCLDKGVSFYDDIGCEAIKVGNDTCPSAYKCLQDQKNQCLFRNKHYNHGDEIKDFTTCGLSCECFIKNNFSHVLCKKVKCPYIELEPDCFPAYEKPDDCCPTKKICPPFEIICDVDGKIYNEGQKFVDENNCFDCICHKDFNGTYQSSYCTRKIFGLELYQQENIKNKCVPLYNSQLGEALCSPDSFICPENVIKIDVIKRETQKSYEELCYFNDEKYKKGEILKVISVAWPFRQETTCSCLLPPFLSCFLD